MELPVVDQHAQWTLSAIASLSRRSSDGVFAPISSPRLHRGSIGACRAAAASNRCSSRRARRRARGARAAATPPRLARPRRRRGRGGGGRGRRRHGALRALDVPQGSARARCRPLHRLHDQHERGGRQRVRRHEGHAARRARFEGVLRKVPELPLPRAAIGGSSRCSTTTATASSTSASSARDEGGAARGAGVPADASRPARWAAALDPATLAPAACSRRSSRAWRERILTGHAPPAGAAARARRRRGGGTTARVRARAGPVRRASPSSRCRAAERTSTASCSRPKRCAQPPHRPPPSGPHPGAARRRIG